MIPDRCPSLLFAAAVSLGAPGAWGQVEAGPSTAAPKGSDQAVVTGSYPDDPRLAAAITMLSKGRFDAAELTARTVLSQHAEIDRAAAILGIALLKQKKYEEARRFLERARDSAQPFPERRHAPHFLGWCCYHLGDLSAARLAFERHAKDVPDEPDTRFGLGVVALGEDRLDEADAQLNRALAGFSAPAKPDLVGQARALTRLSDLAMRRGEVEKAEELLERAVQASAVQHETWSKLARVRDRLGKTKEAEAARANADRILAALGRKTAEPQQAPANAPAPEIAPGIAPANAPATAPATTPPAAAPATDAPRPIRFTDVTAQSGLSMTTTSGASPSTVVLEVKGGGLGLIDFDGDGDLDLFVPNGATLENPEAGPGARLFRNDGGLRFTDVTAASGIRHRRWSFGVTAGDVDGDGRDDLFIACFGPDVLLRNRGDGTFEDVSARAGIADPRWGTSAAFADLDLDGDLDLFVCNYLDFDPSKPLAPATFKGMKVVAGPRGYPAAADAIYENRGDGTFVDRSIDSGVAAVKPGYGLNLAILDLTGDGKPDIFVGNDSQPNNLFTPTAPWSYRDDGLRSGIAVNAEGIEQATMGVAVADIDGNGRPDVFTTNFSSDTNTLHLNLDGRSFDDRTNQYGLGAPSRTLVGWGAGFFDFDHDGDEDLLSVNGHVYPQATTEAMDSEYAQRPLLMERRGARFHALAEAGAWKLEPHVDRTAVFADLDLDGDVDAVVAGLNEPLRVLRNDHDAADDWVVVVPRDTRPGIGNRHAVGAVVELATKEAVKDTVQRRWVVGGGPFQSNNAPEVYFGVPRNAGPMTVTVRFPDGTVATEQIEAAGRRVVVDRAAVTPRSR